MSAGMENACINLMVITHQPISLILFLELFSLVYECCSG
ncbi:hypothetical protein ASZ90_015210 [hydrocarbon metagenome]|uniref:Uncharacterized protein n=1 Tax=hydrocarbon metagenome TaxID=938273 RepID=A0A0W8F3I4_9ZZZZ